MAEEKQYTHFIAIDFGTAGCGVATSLKGSEEIRAFLKWIPSGRMLIKSPTIILLDHNLECEGFGLMARNRYHKQAVKYKNEFNKYYLFEYFKMNLYEEKKVSHDLMIKAVDGKTLPAVIVFSKALEYIKTTVLNYLNEQIEHPSRSILWIVTVPAIWSPAAKQIMRTAAEKANFTIGRDSLQLALEPEAASLYCIGSIEELLGDSTSGHHLIVDCGGGTVDVVAHRWYRVPPGNRLCVDETHKVHGGPYGSFAINAEFEKLLFKIFKIDESEVRAMCGSQWSKLIFEEFEKAKCPFESFNLDSEATINILKSIRSSITKLRDGKTISELIDGHKKDLESDLDLSQKLHNCAKKFNKTTSEIFGSYKKLKWDDDEDNLVVPFVVMAILFIPVTDQIVKIVEDVLNADKDNSIKSICMVGGFSENKFLFSEIDAHFSSRVKVKTVPTPSHSVLFGSVKFGKNCEIIRSRIMSQTLGIETWDDFQADKHDEKRKYEDTNTGKCYCTQVFTEFVKIGQSISIENAMPSQVFIPVQSKDNTCCVSIFGSFEKHPKYINDKECYRAGEIIIKDLPPPINGIPCPITVQMDVRGTEIVATAVSNAEGGSHPLNLKLDWMKDKFTASK